MRHKGWLALLLLAFLAGWFGHSLFVPGAVTGPVPGGELATPRTEDPRPIAPGLAAAPAQPPGPGPVARPRAEEPAVVAGTVQTSPQAGDTSAGTLRVRVREFSGKPVPGIALSLRGGQAGSSPQSATTDADGLAEFTGLSAGEWQLQTTFPEGMQTALAAVYAGRVTDLSLVHPARGVLFVGTVRDAGGAPLEGVTVTLSTMEAGCYATLKTTTDASGAYRFEGVRPGGWNVSLSTNTSGFSQANHFFVPPGETYRKDFRAGPLLRGAVRDHGTRTPIAGVNIQSMRGGSYLEAVKTEADGTFGFKGLGPGTVDLMLSRSGYGLTIVRSVEVPAEGAAVDLELSQAARLRLHITDAQGQPVSGSVYIGVTSADQKTSIGTNFFADADGKAAYDEILPGSYVLDFKADGRGAARVETTLVLGENSLEIRLEAK